MNEKLSIFIQSIKDIVVVINNRGIIQIANTAITSILGYTPDEIKGKNVSVLMGHPHKIKHDSYIKNYQDTGVKKIIGIGREVIAVHKNGTKVPVRLNVSKLESEGRELFVGILYDLTNQTSITNHISQLNTDLEETIDHQNEALSKAMQDLIQKQLDLEQEILERKLIEDKLRAAQADIQKALVAERELNELKTRFISTASHEFRTPLSSILSSASLIERYTTTETNDKRQKHITRIKSSVQNLTQILNDFLSLTKLEEDKVEHKKHFFNLKDVITNTIEEVSVSAKNNQVFDFQHEGDHTIYSNMLSIKNILLNLLSNALKYSHSDSTIYVNCSVNQEAIKLSVRDEGIGIPLDQQRHLFSRFFRADNATAIQGTGLGLYIVKKYLENLGGTISFKSKLDQGTTFNILIPQATE